MLRGAAGGLLRCHALAFRLVASGATRAMANVALRSRMFAANRIAVLTTRALSELICRQTKDEASSTSSYLLAKLAIYFLMVTVGLDF